MQNIALVTGASGGIGRELALAHARSGGDLILVARSEEKLLLLKEEVRSEYGVEALIFAKDLSRPEVAEDIYRHLIEMGTEVDLLINNAGFGGFGFFHETHWDKEARMIDLNVRTLTHLTKLFLPAMIVRGRGRIMNVASTAAFVPGPLMAVYYATKHYVLSFTEAIANELSHTGVTATALCPGPTASGFQTGAEIEESRLVRGKRLPTSKEVAQYGYKAMLRGKRIAVHGAGNRLQLFVIRFAPRRLVAAVVRRLQEKE
ncbi:MAG: SDR family NAD(P)-dependent oxidoreductase [Spirochaetaceae bacterium]